MHLPQGLAILMGLAILVLLLRVLLRPAVWLLRVGVNTVLGGVAIWLWDQGLSHLGYAIGLNPVTAVVTGVLGVPGFGLLLALKLWH